MVKTRLLIADDQILFAESLSMVLKANCDEIDQIWLAHNGKTAIDIALEKEPDVILMDIFMPVLNGVEATKAIKEKLPAVNIIILTTFSADEYVREALMNGATGYLFKDMSSEELVNAIKTVRDGSVLIPQRIAQKLLEQVPGAGNETLLEKEIISVSEHTLDEGLSKQPKWLNILSKREKEVLRYISQGLNNEEISRAMFLTEQTVKNYVSSIYSKIGAHNRMSAMKMGLSANVDKE